MMDEKILSSIVSDILVQNLKGVRDKGLEEVQSLREEFNCAMAKAAIGSSASVTSALEVLSDKVSKALSLQEEAINKLVSKAESLSSEIESFVVKNTANESRIGDLQGQLSEAITVKQVSSMEEYLKELLLQQIEDLRKSIPSLEELSKAIPSLPEPDGRVDVLEGAVRVLQEKMVGVASQDAMIELGEALKTEWTGLHDLLLLDVDGAKKSLLSIGDKFLDVEKFLQSLSSELEQVRKDIPVIPAPVVPDPDPRIEGIQEACSGLLEHVKDLEEKVGPLFHESVEIKTRLESLASYSDSLKKEIEVPIAHLEELQQDICKLQEQAAAPVVDAVARDLGVKLEAALAEVEKEFSSLRDSDNLDHNQRLGRLERLTKDASEVAEKVVERLTGLESSNQKELLEELSIKVNQIQELFDREVKTFLPYAESLPVLLQEKVEKGVKEADEAATYKIEEYLGTVHKRIEAVEEEGEGRIKTAENFFGSELAALRSDVEAEFAEFAEALKVNREISEARMKELDHALSESLLSSFQTQNAVASKEFFERLASTREDFSLRLGEAKDYFSNRIETLLHTFVTQKETVASVPTPAPSQVLLDLPEPETWYSKTWPSNSCVTHKGGTWFARRTTDKEPSASCPDWVLTMNGVEKMVVSCPSYSTLRVDIAYSNGSSTSEEMPLHLNRHKGKWNETSEYSFNDEVAWDNGTWRWTKWETPSKGVRPPAEGWTLAAKGEKGRSQKGDKGVGISSISREGDQIVFVLTDGSVSRFDMPVKVVEAAKVEEVPGIRMNFLGPFQEGSAYTQGSVVRYSGSLYLALEDNASRPDAKSNSWELLS